MEHLSDSPGKKNVKAIIIIIGLLLYVVFIFFTIVVCIRAAPNRASPFIQDFYVPSLVVPALNKTTAFNTSVFIDLKFKRAATLTSYGYGDFQMTLSYRQYRSESFPVGTRMVEGFSMGWRRRVDVKVAVEAVGMPWEEASQAVSGGNVVAMVVELMVSDETSWVARVAMDASGHMVSKKPIEFEEWMRDN